MSQNATKKINMAWIRGLVATCMSVAIAALSVTGTPAQSAQAAAPAWTQPGANYTCLWYRVRPGDTLLALADRYDTDALTIRRINGLKSTRIYTGQVLCIPRSAAPNPGPGPNPVPIGPWYAEYWNNTAQSGPATLVRNDPSINFNWGYGSPDPARIFADNFSARWTRNIDFGGGVWRFGVNADDGVRLTVDNQVVLDMYTNVGNVQKAVDVPLGPGLHRVSVDYVEQTGLAFITVNMFRVGGNPPPPPWHGPGPGPGDNGKFINGPWSAQYYPNPNFQGNPAVRTEPALRFDWHGNPPLPGFPGGFWTARYAQTRYFNPGVYQFVARVDDGVRITINGVQVMNEWREQSTRTFASTVKFGAGNYNIVVEYIQFGGSSDFSLYWDFLGNPDAPKPQIQVVPAMPFTGSPVYIKPLP